MDLQLVIPLKILSGETLAPGRVTGVLTMNNAYYIASLVPGYVYITLEEVAVDWPSAWPKTGKRFL